MNRRTGSTIELPHVDEIELPDGRSMSRGDEFSLHGGGRFRFLYRYERDGSIAAFGPIGSSTAKHRAFPPDRVRTVHRRKTT